MNEWMRWIRYGMDKNGIHWKWMIWILTLNVMCQDNVDWFRSILLRCRRISKWFRLDFYVFRSVVCFKFHRNEKPFRCYSNFTDIQFRHHHQMVTIIGKASWAISMKQRPQQIENPLIASQLTYSFFILVSYCDLICVLFT